MRRKKKPLRHRCVVVRFVFANILCIHGVDWCRSSYTGRTQMKWYPVDLLSGNYVLHIFIARPNTKWKQCSNGREVWETELRCPNENREMKTTATHFHFGKTQSVRSDGAEKKRKIMRKYTHAITITRSLCQTITYEIRHRHAEAHFMILLCSLPIIWLVFGIFYFILLFSLRQPFEPSGNAALPVSRVLKIQMFSSSSRFFPLISIFQIQTMVRLFAGIKKRNGRDKKSEVF